MINEASHHELIDEAERETGLRHVRMSNFEILLSVLTKLKPNGGRLIDVGCAHGWFVEAASGKFDAIGIEPDKTVFNSTAARGIPVREGYFPDALALNEKFDVVVFNDVFEHIPGSQKLLSSCHQRLCDDGLLVLNLPSSDGIFYKLSRLAGRLGYFGFFERLWQKDLPSPHVHYFNRSNLDALLKKSGFKPLKSGTLPTLSFSGLYTRISYAGNMSVFSKVFIYCAISLALPVFRLLPSDVTYVVARKA